MPEPVPQQVILLVEDHPLNMLLAADLLTLGGFKVLQARDGATALELIKATRPDLMLLDIRLPEMDGFELFRKIRQDPRFNAVKIVALTASVMREEEQKIKDFGFNGFLAKPIDTKRFVDQVRGFLG